MSEITTRKELCGSWEMRGQRKWTYERVYAGVRVCICMCICMCVQVCVRDNERKSVHHLRNSVRWG